MKRNWFDKKVLILGLSKSGTAAAEYLNAKGVPRHNRNNIPLLCDDKEVLWVTGVGLSNNICVKVKPTHVIEMRQK